MIYTGIKWRRLKRIKIKLNTTNAVWEQSGEWKIILDILSGDITGDFTIYMPPFSIMEYDTLEVYVTVNGATYAEITSRGFDVSVAGPSAAEELLSSVHMHLLHPHYYSG